MICHLYTYGGFSQIAPEVLGISLLKFVVPLPETILHMLKEISPEAILNQSKRTSE